jgi:hypothetical protein
MKRAFKKRPRKGLMRMGAHEFTKKMRETRRTNFEMKKWIRDYYDKYGYED